MEAVLCVIVKLLCGPVDVLQGPASGPGELAQKPEAAESEPQWPEVPPILNQGDDRRRNKYLRKDYLKVLGMGWVVGRGVLVAGGHVCCTGVVT